MRRCVVLLMFLLLAGCAYHPGQRFLGPRVIETPLAEMPAKVEKGEGCMGAPVKRCLAILGDVIFVNDYNAAIKHINEGTHLDVAGKPIDKEEFVQLNWFRAITKTDIERANIDIPLNIDRPHTFVENAGMFQIYYNREQIVTKILLRFPFNPFSARTQEQYEGAGVYEAFAYTLGASCEAASSPNAAYVFFETVVKNVPSLTQKDVVLKLRQGLRTLNFNPNVRDLNVCGHRLSFIAEYKVKPEVLGYKGLVEGALGILLTVK